MFAEVIIDQDVKAIDKTFDYRKPENLDLKVGMRVFVPFGKRIVQGYVVELKDKTEYDESKVKNIISAIEDFSAIKGEMLEVMRFMTKKNHLTMASTLRLFLPSQMREGKVREIFETFYSLKEKDFIPAKNAKKQIEIVDFLKEHGKTSSSVLGEKFGYGAVKALYEKGILEKDKEKIKRKPFVENLADKKVELNLMQKKAIAEIGGTEVFVLHGVTGSGKTEVYMHLIERELKKGKNAILLVPEISLTPQIMASFKARFGDFVALLHSGLSAGERFDEWKRIFAGEARIVIGARSAIFAPIENLGIIIIDEEHEQSYVSESNPRYYTHDIAKFRASFNHCPLVLGSATPSVESYQKAVAGEYKLIELPTRANGRDLPAIQIVDMIGEIRRGNSGIFSAQLLAELGQVVQSKNKQ